MNSTNIQQIKLIKQATREGSFTMQGLSLTRLLHSLIREYGTYSHGSMTVDPYSLSLSDKKLVLSHITDSGEYKWIVENATRVEAAFDEYINHIQQLFEAECDDVYRENMEESRRESGHSRYEEYMEDRHG